LCLLGFFSGYFLLEGIQSLVCCILLGIVLLILLLISLFRLTLRFIVFLTVFLGIEPVLFFVIELIL